MQPVVRSLCFQGYLLFTGGLYVRLESILTALVFDHALRIRLTAEVSADDDAEEDGASHAETSRPESRATTLTAGAGGEDDDEAERAHSRAASSGSTAVGSTASAAAVPKEGAKKDKKAKEKAKSANLTGKINNLVTSDMCVLVLCSQHGS
jgi:hypothetical protein